ncbi:MAG: aminotransferase class IV [Caldilineae bacterium]|nr:aminotransferase class IV family protein [Anaerolineae bacterium]MCB9154956.1 aminotransferase class IV [Caldilineae bacterium]
MTNQPTPNAILNGELLPAERAGFSVANQSLVDSFGIYETIKVEEGRFFHLSWHLRRLGDSASILSLELPASLEEIGVWCRKLADTSSGFGLLRIVAYGSDGVHEAQCGIYMKPQPKLADALFDPGVWLVTSEGERTWPLAKSTNCLAQALARFKAQSQGAYEGLIVDRHGHVTEGSTCNLLVVRDGVLLRPLAGTALEGVTENIAVELAAAAGVSVQRTALQLADLAGWDEAFITSTNRRIMPVRQIDDTALPSSPGPVTRLLMSAFRDYEKKHGWGE